MNQRIRWSGLCFVAGLLLAGRAAGADLRLDSGSSDLRLSLAGPVAVSGTTPLILEDLPAGRYRLAFDGPASATGGGRLLIGPGGALEAHRLHGPGSLLLPPGAAHLAGHESGRGLTFLALGAGSAVMAADRELARMDARDEYQRALNAYGRASSGDEAREQRYRALYHRDREADQQELRNLWAGWLGFLWLGSGVESWALTPAASVHRTGVGDYRLTVPGAEGGPAALRSLLVPGAGQRSLGHTGRGNRFLMMVGVTGASAIVAHQAFLNARRDELDYQRRYDEATSAESAALLAGRLRDASNEASDWSRVRWGLAALAGGIHLWNVLDAASLGHGQPQTSPIGFGIFPDRSGFRFGVTWSHS